MEIGCPAVDKGANQPNVFVDPKSFENALPYYSAGTRDDLMQARFIKTFRDAFDWTSDGYIADLNPVSIVNGQRMVNIDRMFVYCWDARPYPAFPNELTYWSDGLNWPLGHWLNGRLDSSDLASLVRQILTDYGFAKFNAASLKGTVPGYVIDRVMAARDALQPLELAYFFDSVESGGSIAFRHRGESPWPTPITPNGCVETRPGDALVSLTRGQETELPASAKIRFISAEDTYAQAVAEARRLTSASGRVAQADLPIVLDDGLAGNIADSWLFEAWAARERASLTLPPSALALEPGDVFSLDVGGLQRDMRVTEISEHGARDIEARSIDRDVYGRTVVPARPAATPTAVQIGSPAIVFLDLPLIDENANPASGFVAALQKPWPGSVAIYASAQASGFDLKALVSAAATLGVTLDGFPAGAVGRFDRATKLRVRLTQGLLSATDDGGMLAGTNRAAIKTPSGGWEIIQFANATLVDVGTYELSTFLRGQFGSDAAMADLIPSGATFVLLDSAVTEVALDLGEIKRPLNWRCGPGNRDIGDASFETREHAFQGTGLVPLAPAHVRASRVGDDIAIRWTRRTRIGGDSWEVHEVPLGEESERYDVDVMDGAVVKRTLTATQAECVYSAAHQISDFGSAQTSLSVRVYQISASVGRGSPRAATV